MSAALNNGLAERQNKIKLSDAAASSVISQYESAPLFSVKADGENLHYQWQYFDTSLNRWINVPGGTNDSLNLVEIPPSMNAVKFRCRIYNEIGETFSNEVILNVNQPTSAPTITAQPQSITVDPVTSADSDDDVYAQVVVSLNGGGGSSEIYATKNISDPSDKAVPTAATTKTYVDTQVKTQIELNETNRKRIVYNEAVLVPDANNVVTWDINHNLNDRCVFVSIIETNTNQINSITCSIVFLDENNIRLQLQSETKFAFHQLMVIISK